MSKSVIILILIIILAGGAAVFVYPELLGNKILPWRLGLDLIGGTHLVYEADMSGVAESDRRSVLDGLRDVMERRVNVFGVSEPFVTTSRKGDNYRIIAELAGIKDPAEAIRQIGRTAFLEFRELPEGAASYASATPSGLTGKYLKRAQAVTNPTTFQPEIEVEFTGEGAAFFEEITGRNVGKPLAIFIDNDLISAPNVQEKITGGRAVITGQFSVKEARNLASLLNAGALPAPIALVSQQTIGASLGLGSLNKTITAGLIGAAAIMLFMIGYYRSLGVFASLALLIYILITLAVFKGVSITMTLSGIAGFILSIGMAVDANILIFERAKEELKKGLSRINALEEGFRRAWPPIRDSNITTIITSLILYTFTSSFVKGFALALLIGVIVSMFSAITVTRALLKTFIKN
jgi:protein-export SecD/SecF family membrane protein